MEDIINKLDVLLETKLFENLNLDILYVIAEEASWKIISEGEIIFSVNDDSDGIYIVASGEVCVARHDRDLKILKKYDFFGELGVIGQHVRLATVRARSEGSLLFIDQTTFDALINEFPEILFSIAPIIINYLRS